MTTATHSAPQLRIGLLLDKTGVAKPVYDFVQWAQTHERLRVTDLILLPSRKNETGQSALARFLFKAVLAIEKAFLAKNKRQHGYLHEHDLAAIVPNSIRLDAADAGRVKSLGLDLLISFASGATGPGLCDAARLGTLSLCHDGDGEDQDSLAGFWQVYRRDDTTGFTITQLTGAKDAVLFRGRVGTQFYYLLNQAALCEKSAYYLRQLVEKIAAAGELPAALPEDASSALPRGLPNAPQVLAYLAGLFWLAGSKVLRAGFSIDYQWNVAFLHSGWRNAALDRAAVIANPSGRYLADPFVISRDGKTFCFVEDYDIPRHLGRISVYELGNDGAAFLGVALAESFHLSFPYLFEHQGALFMCPETSGNRDIRIYRCVDFPTGWKLDKVLVRNVSAVDTMLFEKDGTWWMFANIDSGQFGDFQELHIFSADSPFTDQWKPHPLNPIFADASRARNGGLVRDGGRIFRVAQRQGFDFYGKATSVNEIRRLDANNYAEERISTITPTFKKGIAGTHHLHSNGQTTVVDFARLGRTR